MTPTAGTARATTGQKTESFRFWLGLAINVAVTLATIAFSYGALSQQVHDLDRNVQELHQDVRELRQQPR